MSTPSKTPLATHYRALVTCAETSVGLLRDNEMRFVAFDRILRHLLDSRRKGSSRPSRSSRHRTTRS